MIRSMRKLVVPLMVVLVLGAVCSACGVAEEGPRSTAPAPGAEEGGAASTVPAATTEALGNAFDVAVRIDGAEKLGGYWFEMAYDPAVVDVLDVEDGGFLEEGSERVMFRTEGPDILTETVRFGAWTVPSGAEAAAGADGSGTLAVIHLEAEAAGTNGLELTQVKLYRTDEAAPQTPEPPQSVTLEVVE